MMFVLKDFGFPLSVPTIWQVFIKWKIDPSSVSYLVYYFYFIVSGIWKNENINTLNSIYKYHFFSNLKFKYKWFSSVRELWWRYSQMGKEKKIFFVNGYKIIFTSIIFQRNMFIINALTSIGLVFKSFWSSFS